MKIWFLLMSVTLSVITLVFSSCCKEPLKNVTAEEARIYITNYDSATDFKNFKTFSIVDSVTLIRNNSLQSKAVSSYDVKVLTAVKSAMQQKGFTLVQKNAQPDLGINVSRITNTFTGSDQLPRLLGLLQ